MTDFKPEMIIVWLALTFFFIALVSTNHFLTTNQNNIIFLVGIGFIVIGFIKTTVV